jgi:hypothetical protein
VREGGAALAVIIGLSALLGACGRTPPPTDRGQASGLFRLLTEGRGDPPITVTDRGIQACREELGGGWIRLGPGASWSLADSIRFACTSGGSRPGSRVERDSGTFTAETDLLRLTSADTIDGQNVLDARLHGDTLLIWRGEDEGGDHVYLRASADPNAPH